MLGAVHGIIATYIRSVHGLGAHSVEAERHSGKSSPSFNRILIDYSSPAREWESDFFCLMDIFKGRFLSSLADFVQKH